MPLSFERAYLLQSIEVLKEGLDSLRIQKHELAKIFEGEKNAMELSFKRKASRTASSKEHECVTISLFQTNIPEQSVIN